MKKKHIILLVILFTVGVYILPLLFTQGYLSSIADFSKTSTSNIGSTIGGITAPIIGIVSSVLLYLALTKQIESNDTQRVKNEIDTILSLMNQMEVELSAIYYTYEVTTPEKQRYQHNYHGIEALDKLINDFIFKDRMRGGSEKLNHYHISRQILIVIKSFEIVESRIGYINVPDDMRLLLKEKMNSFYEYRLKRPLSLLELAVEINGLAVDEHSNKIFTFLQRMGKDEQIVVDMKDLL